MVALIVVAGAAGTVAWALRPAPKTAESAANGSDAAPLESRVSEEVVATHSTAEPTPATRRAKPCAGCPGKQGKTEPGAIAAPDALPPWRLVEPVAERVLGHAADAPLPASTRSTLRLTAMPEMGHGFVVTSWGPPGTQQQWRLEGEHVERSSAAGVTVDEPADAMELWTDIEGRLRRLVRSLHEQTWELDAAVAGYRLVSLSDTAAILAWESAPAGGWERVRMDLDAQGGITRVSWAQWDPVRERAWRCLVSLATGPSLELQRPE